MDKNSFKQRNFKKIGQKIFLRPLALEDVGPSYVSWLNNPEVNRYLESKFSEHTLDSTKSFVQAMNESPKDFLFGIFDKADDLHIGNVKLGGMNSVHGYADMGLIIGSPNHWGKGFATETIRLATEIGLEDLGLRRVFAGAYLSNVGSIRAFEKVGYTREGTLRSHYLCDGKPMDSVILGFVKGINHFGPPNS